MANILLNHANIDQAADDMEMASRAMAEAMTNCMTAIKNNQEHLSGSLAQAADAFNAVLSANNADMNTEIAAGVEALRTMHGLLRDADKRAAAGIG
ncbi:hypothetical protein ACGF13_34710 [Kitasatospora sp. NPDC048286]|uniref:hypothetical protein n=1 Tax=unclassified Kitasatospora TaxID=2633591 RepID=UPI003711D467